MQAQIVTKDEYFKSIHLTEKDPLVWIAMSDCWRAATESNKAIFTFLDRFIEEAEYGMAAHSPLLQALKDRVREWRP